MGIEHVRVVLNYISYFEMCDEYHKKKSCDTQVC